MLSDARSICCWRRCDKVSHLQVKRAVLTPPSQLFMETPHPWTPRLSSWCSKPFSAAPNLSMIPYGCGWASSSLVAHLRGVWALLSLMEVLKIWLTSWGPRRIHSSQLLICVFVAYFWRGLDSMTIRVYMITAPTPTHFSTRGNQFMLQSMCELCPPRPLLSPTLNWSLRQNSVVCTTL